MRHSQDNARGDEGAGGDERKALAEVDGRLGRVRWFVGACGWG